jgi:hypothetical protein
MKTHVVMGNVSGTWRRFDIMAENAEEAISKFCAKMKKKYQIEDSQITQVKACVRTSGVK